ncbi:MAG: hypothetical protein ACI4AM_00475, partial [Muribaculaceae bacterium]
LGIIFELTKYFCNFFMLLSIFFSPSLIIKKLAPAALAPPRPSPEEAPPSLPPLKGRERGQAQQRGGRAPGRRRGAAKAARPETKISDGTADKEARLR